MNMFDENSNPNLYKNDEVYAFLIKHYSFWPFYILSIIVFFILSIIFLRYTPQEYVASTHIEIIDKAQDSEMALPTSMTIFNRSMINLDNEIGRLSSFRINESVVKDLELNIRYFTNNTINTKEIDKYSFENDFDIHYKIKTDTISVNEKFDITVSLNNSNIIIEHYDKYDDLIRSYKFQTFDTSDKENNLPFDLKFRNNKEYDSDIKRTISFSPVETVTENFISKINISAFKPGERSFSGSDQLKIVMRSNNEEIITDYLNTLVSTFDFDGIKDRQLEYKRTINFIEDRAVYLRNELKVIEDNKESFKVNNNVSDISANTTNSISQQTNYDSEIFRSKSQLDLLSLFKDELENKDYNLVPSNIGLDNSNLNFLINEYNLLVKQRLNLISSGAGLKNNSVSTIESQLDVIFNNIKVSVDNYSESLKLNLVNLEEKESEFLNIFKSIPEYEKTLRAIERELEIKESLFLLLLQKKEEASINLAVVKPTIKVIDYARENGVVVYPIPLNIHISFIFIGLIMPFCFFSLVFYFDNKVYTKRELTELLPNIPVVGEVPFLQDLDVSNILNSSNSRSALYESIRICIANLNFTLFSLKPKNNIILITSSLKGEGKTLISVLFSSLLSKKFKKVLLIGVDLRNPQIHKFFDIDKNRPGVSNYIYSDTFKIDDIITKMDDFDLITSGAIPPNPTELLGSNRFKNMLDELRKEYDCIILDSAPCLLVSDTLEISKLVDSTIYAFRAGKTKKEILKFVNELNNSGKLKNLNLILNGVGQRSGVYSYGYNYQYGYKYSYNYGYGYEYISNDD